MHDFYLIQYTDKYSIPRTRLLEPVVPSQGMLMGSTLEPNSKQLTPIFKVLEKNQTRLE